MTNVLRFATAAMTAVLIPVFWIVGFGLAGAPAFAQSGLSPTDARAIAKEAYVYGFPIVDNYRVQLLVLRRQREPRVQGAVEPTVQHPAASSRRTTRPSRRRTRTRRIPSSASTCAPSRSSSRCRRSKDRYWCSSSTSTRTTTTTSARARRATAAGSFMIAGPAWKGEHAEGHHEGDPLRDGNRVCAFRTQLFNPSDLENVKKVQAGYRVQPLSAVPGQAAPTGRAGRSTS